jgi:CBS domain-containing protein
MSTVSEVLRQKGPGVFTIDPHSTVFDAITQMVRHGVGALIVVEDDNVLGIITERDYLRKVAIEGRTSRTTMVHEIMSSPVLAVQPADDLNQCLALMTERRVRHLPVIERGALVGLVSIGDLVKCKVMDQQGEIDRLFDYIQTSSGAPAY